MVNASPRHGGTFVAFRPKRPYLTVSGDLPMTRTPAAAPSPALARPMLVLAAVAGVLMLAALALWGWYGTTVFFEMLRAGFAACF
jgi:hypothetical protein